MRRNAPPRDELATLAPFDALSPSARALLAPHTDRLALRAGTTLARQGRLAREVVVVLAGTARSSRRDATEGATAGPGAVIGAGAVVAGTTHGTTWTAVSDVEVVVVNGPAFRAVVAEGLHTAA